MKTAKRDFLQTFVLIVFIIFGAMVASMMIRTW